MPLYKSTSSTESSEDRSSDDFFVKCRLNHSPISHVERAQLESLIYETSQALQSTSDPGSRDRLSEILVFQRSLLSPIRCLPPDIMGEIFSFTIAGNPIQYGSKKPSTTIDAWKLTWVCTWWRDLALSQPALWSSMKFSFGHRDSYEKTLFLKEYLIPRSRLMPLDLSLEPYYIPYSFTPGSGPVLNVLVDEVERWKHLKLLDFNQALIDQLVAMIISKQVGASSLPLLQSLTFASSHQSYDFGGVFMHCPSLRKLRVFRLEHTQVAVDIQNLVHLEIQIDSNASFVKLLRACPLLQTLAVGLVSEPVKPQEPSSQESFTHNYLTTLNLSCVHCIYFYTSWQFIRLPKLTHLGIRAYGHPVQIISENRVINASNAGLGAAFDILLDMLLSSGCSLQTASIYNVVDVYHASSDGYSLHFTDNIVDDFLAKLPVSSTGQRILTKGKAGVDTQLDLLV